MKGSDFQIRERDEHGENGELHLNGVRLPNVKGYTIRSVSGEINEVVVTFLASSITGIIGDPRMDLR